jgi:hypothetical protein
MNELHNAAMAKWVCWRVKQAAGDDDAIQEAADAFVAWLEGEYRTVPAFIAELRRVSFGGLPGYDADGNKTKD